MNPSPPPPHTAAIVVVGNEILSGKTRDENGPWLLGRLRTLGVETRRIETVPDEVDLIVDAVRRCRALAAHVITSGGIGPTHDDVTVEAVAHALDVPVVRHLELERLLRGFFGERINEARLRMADVPAGSEILQGEGESLRFPAILAANVLVLPGVPELLRGKFEAVQERYRAPGIALRNLFLGVGEGAIADLLTEAARRFAPVAIGSYPRFQVTDHKVKVTVEGRDRAQVDACAAWLRERLGEAVLRESEG